MGRIKIILLIVYTILNVHHCYHCFKGKCCSWFEGLLSCDTLETVMHYHQNPYVRNVTRLHSNYEHKRQIKTIKDCFITVSGQLVPKSIRTRVNSYPFWSTRTQVNSYPSQLVPFLKHGYYVSVCYLIHLYIVASFHPPLPHHANGIVNHLRPR